MGDTILTEEEQLKFDNINKIYVYSPLKFAFLFSLKAFNASILSVVGMTCFGRFLFSK